MRIFVIDDDPDMVALMQALLARAGHDVDGCLSASFALPTIAAKRPDLVLCDLVMAEVNGLELIDEIKGRTDLKNTKVIMVSGKDGQHWKSEAAKRGAVGYIVKPLDPATFAETVESIAR